ncbi:MAG TPA: peroxiredoxin [Acidimicrobiales bacterium]|nr:peroxiredoxin [Acidimicrobiales bacterium]
MTIAVGDRIPDVELRTMGDDGPRPVRSVDVLGRGRVVLFGLPGAFTPTCTDFHLPGFVLRSEELRAKGVEVLACVSVNDAWVMNAWGSYRRVGDKVLMLADGNGEFTRALGLEEDLSARGLGMRSQRYAAVLEDGVVRYLGIEEGPGLSVSGAEAVLAAL